MNRAPKSFWATVSAISWIAAGLAIFGCSRDAPPDRLVSGKLRIVSLAPSVTEILFALKSEDSLVGATDHCDYPPQAANIERVGGFGAPNLEKLLALSPDLVIAAGLEREEIADVLRRSGIRVLNVRTRNFEELFDAIRQIGEAADKPQQAEAVITGMRAELEAIAARNGAERRGQRPKVFVEIGEHPLMTAGGASFLDDLIVRAGGVNVAHEISETYPSINPEKVIEWNPDAILVAPMGRPGDAAVQLSRRIGWADISAVKGGRVIDDIHPDLLFRPGPRLIDGVKALAARLRTLAVRQTESVESGATPYQKGPDHGT
ncbi:MAG: ABC transporter substrate-binding protein [Thermoguttaceae bacterium]